MKTNLQSVIGWQSPRKANSQLAFWIPDVEDELSSPATETSPTNIV